MLLTTTPAVSSQTANGASLAATELADPEELPPAILVGSYAFNGVVMPLDVGLIDVNVACISARFVCMQRRPTTQGPGM